MYAGHWGEGGGGPKLFCVFVWREALDLDNY